MGEPGEESVTELLLAWGHGDTTSRNRLLELVYDELRRLAATQLRRERPEHTLQATALVNEAYLRLVDQTRVQWRNRAHFFAIAARLMRRILVDHARRHGAAKRGGGVAPLALAEGMVSGAQAVDLVQLDEALDRLAGLDPRCAEIVEMRFFGGLTVEETAGALGLSAATVKREWAAARAWLHRALSPRSSGPTDA